MRDEHNIEKLISLLCCSDCKTRFSPSSIKLVETKNNLVIVKMVCDCCNKKFVLAFMDMSYPIFGVQQVKCAETIENNEVFEENNKTYENLSPITYDELIEAHEFIQNFEENWRRFLDRRKYNRI